MSGSVAGSSVRAPLRRTSLVRRPTPDASDSDSDSDTEALHARHASTATTFSLFLASQIQRRISDIVIDKTVALEVSALNTLSLQDFCLANELLMFQGLSRVVEQLHTRVDTLSDELVRVRENLSRCDALVRNSAPWLASPPVRDLTPHGDTSRSPTPLQLPNEGDEEDMPHFIVPAQEKIEWDETLESDVEESEVEFEVGASERDTDDEEDELGELEDFGDEDGDIYFWDFGDDTGDLLDAHVPDTVVTELPEILPDELDWVARNVDEFRHVKWAARPA
ncbi:hypothetical protein OF83DRAFT_1088444, partial [Amylostereum chailletii]